jgi:excisionase family DNA binding protein
VSLKSVVIALVAAAPPDAMVTVRWLAEQLAADGVSEEKPEADAHEREARVDLTVEQVAARFGRKGTSTVRGWLARGELPGAYRLHGREWRIPVEAVEEMQRAQAAKPRAASRGRSTTATTDIGEWRKHVPKTGA